MYHFSYTFRTHLWQPLGGYITRDILQILLEPLHKYKIPRFKMYVLKKRYMCICIYIYIYIKIYDTDNFFVILCSCM